MPVEHERIRSALLQGSADSIATIDPETLFFVESELIEDHLEGSLTDSESEQFLSNFLVTEERRDLLNEVRILKRFSSGAFGFDASVLDEPSDDSEKPADSSSSTAKVILLVCIAAILIYISVRLLRG